MTTVRTAVHNRATTNRPGGGPRVRLIRAVEWIRSVLRTTTTSLVPGNVALMELAHGNWVTATLYVAAKLNIADELAGGPLGAEEIARRVGADPDATRRIMRALASKAVFKQTNDGRFALTPVGQALRSDTHGSMRDFILFIGCPEHWELWGSLLHSVRTGKPATDELRGMPFFSYLDTNPRYAEVFNNAMTRFSELSVDAVANAYDFTQFSVVADVGGGHGRLLATILAAAHDSRGILYDLPSVVDGAGPTLEAAGVEGRCTRAGGSFFDAVPEGADAYVMKSIVHDWDDEDALRILRNIRAAIESDGTLLLVEFVLSERPSAHVGLMFDVEMLVNLGGRERTRADFERLLSQAGFRLSRVIDTVSPLSIVEALPI